MRGQPSPVRWLAWGSAGEELTLTQPAWPKLGEAERHSLPSRSSLVVRSSKVVRLHGYRRFGETAFAPDHERRLAHLQDGDRERRR
jgi:hypothetical protein